MVIDKPFKRYNPIGNEELEAAEKVIKEGILSQFLGAWHPDFYGGEKVKEFEQVWASYFNVKHAVTMNSLTSGLIAAVGALGIEPGDEVIVSPWTMCASATSILHWNALPVFADIDPRTFCLDPKSIEANITPSTKAIIAVDIFGQSTDIDAILKLAKKHDLKVISDAAQSPGAKVKERYAGTLADIGGYSLNYHKHIHTGEGGVMITEDDQIAERMKLIRNHAEAVVGPKGHSDLTNMVGYNFRLGEIEAAIGLAQLKKLSDCVASRQRAAARLTEGLKTLPGLQTPYIQPGNTHVFYIYPLVLDLKLLGTTRDKIYSALKAEGLPNIMQGYQNVHLFPMYQKKIAFGKSGFPWNSEFCRRDINYQKGICPVAETLHDTTFLGLTLCTYDFSDSEIDQIILAFKKVWANLGAVS